MVSKQARADVLPVRQQTQYNCVTTSLAMALRALGVSEEECQIERVNKVVGAMPLQGAAWEPMLAAANHYGMRATLTLPSTVLQLKGWTDAGKPVVIAWNPEGREWSHASLVFDVTEDAEHGFLVHIADPNIPDPDETVRVVPKKEFYSKWYEKAPQGYMIRRPACVIEREITSEGRQVMASWSKAASRNPRVAEEYDRIRDEELERGTYRRRAPQRSYTPQKPDPSMRVLRTLKDSFDAGNFQVGLTGEQFANGLIAVDLSYPYTLDIRGIRNHIQRGVARLARSDRSWSVTGSMFAFRRYRLEGAPEYGDRPEVGSLEEAVRDVKLSLSKIKPIEDASLRGPPSKRATAARGASRSSTERSRVGGSRKAYLNADPMQREAVRRYLCDVLAVLRAQALSYQTSHWQVKGDDYYGNHLLFMRLYESVGEQIDGLAEKMVGYLGVGAVDLTHQMKHIAAYTARWTQVPDHLRRGLLSERDVQAALKRAYDEIKALGVMTLGLDDFIMATANAHDSNEYLLQQALERVPGVGGKQASRRRRVSSGAPTAEKHFYDNPEKREVREFAETGALSNSPEVAAEASEEEQLDLPAKKEVAKAEAAPPTPDEIAEEPGGKAVSTLNRFVVDTEEPEAEPAVAENEDLLESKKVMAAWIREIEAREKKAGDLYIEIGDSKLGWDRSTKRFSIFASDFRNLNLRGKVQVFNPRTRNSMFFGGALPIRDAEGDIESWLLRGENGVTLIIYND